MAEYTLTEAFEDLDKLAEEDTNNTEDNSTVVLSDFSQLKPEEKAAYKQYSDAAKAGYLDIDSFHKAFDPYIKAVGLEDLFGPDGKLIDRKTYGRIKEVEGYLQVVLKKLWGYLFGDSKLGTKEAADNKKAMFDILVTNSNKLTDTYGDPKLVSKLRGILGNDCGIVATPEYTAKSFYDNFGRRHDGKKELDSISYNFYSDINDPDTNLTSSAPVIVNGPKGSRFSNDFDLFLYRPEDDKAKINNALKDLVNKILVKALNKLDIKRVQNKIWSLFPDANKHLLNDLEDAITRKGGAGRVEFIFKDSKHILKVSSEHDIVMYAENNIDYLDTLEFVGAYSNCVERNYHGEENGWRYWSFKKALIDDMKNAVYVPELRNATYGTAPYNGSEVKILDKATAEEYIQNSKGICYLYTSAGIDTWIVQNIYENTF